MSWRWGPHTLRARLTLWYMAVMVAVLGVYVSVVLALVARNLSEALDARLRSDFRWAAEMAEQGPDGSLSWFEGEPWTEGPWLQVWSPRGELIYRTSVAARLPVPASETLVDEADGRIRSLPDDPAPFRLLGARATVAGRPVVIQVGRSEAFMRLEVRELAVLLLLGLPLTVAVAGAGGYLLARGALSPRNLMALPTRFCINWASCEASADRLGSGPELTSASLSAMATSRFCSAWSTTVWQSVGSKDAPRVPTRE